MFTAKFYNQRKNYNWNGKLSGSIQCFYTSVRSFVSVYKPSLVTDSWFKDYVDDVEIKVGNKGLAETFVPKQIKSGERTGAYWLVHYTALKKILPDKNITWISKNNIDNLKILLKKSPVIVGVSKLGGLSGGHIILVVGYSNGFFTIVDPFGNPNTNYKDQNGQNVQIAESLLTKHLGNQAIYSNSSIPKIKVTKKSNKPSLIHLALFGSIISLVISYFLKKNDP